MQGNHLQEEVNRIVAGMDNQNEQEDLEQGISLIDEPAPLQDIYVYIVREHDEEVLRVIDCAAPGAPERAQDTSTQDHTPTRSGKTSTVLAWCTLSLAALLPLASLLLQFYLILHPFTATIAIIPKSQQIFFNGTVQLGRMLAPTTVRQSQTVPTTGKGHQDPKQAQGYITLYNGLFTSQIIQAGTILTGQDGVRIITDQAADVPSANPPSFGYTTVSAHAIIAGSRGDIEAYDINQACCATAIKAVNTASFHGGADERNFHTVNQADIHSTSTLLKTHLTQGLTIALQKQMKNGEVMIAPTCTPIVRSDHQPGDEAATVRVTVSVTCSAVAYDQDGLRVKVTDLLKSQAAKQLGAGYRIRGNPHITVTSATPAKQVTLSFHSVSTWGYALSSVEQTAIKKVIAGRTKEQAMQLLASLPGIETASIKASGFGDDTRLPKHPEYIQIVVIDGLYQYHHIA